MCPFASYPLESKVFVAGKLVVSFTADSQTPEQSSENTGWIDGWMHGWMDRWMGPGDIKGLA